MKTNFQMREKQKIRKKTKLKKNIKNTENQGQKLIEGQEYNCERKKCHQEENQTFTAPYIHHNGLEFATQDIHHHSITATKGHKDIRYKDKDWSDSPQL